MNNYFNNLRIVFRSLWPRKSNIHHLLTEDEKVINALRMRQQIHNLDIEVTDLRYELKENSQLRKKHKPLQDAYEQYQLMLTMYKGK